MSGETCGACGLEDPPVRRKKAGKRKAKKEAGIGWICCDSCQKWFHNICVRVTQSLLADISSYLYLCERCTVVGSLIPKATVNNVTSTREVEKQIEELSEHIKKIESELASLQSNLKKQCDRLQNKIHTNVQQTQNKATVYSDNVTHKLEQIHAGVKLAKICSKSVNSYRISINKVPHQAGENVRSIVGNFLSFLCIPDAMSHVTSCFRLAVKPSKWTDRSITPTILVVFDSVDIKTNVLQMYFKKHKEAKLCNLKSGLPLEYRFTVNEMLSIDSFRIRNLALRMKQNKLVESVYVRNDSVSVRLPGHQKYTLVDDATHLLALVNAGSSINESSVFFDAESAEFSLQN